MIDVNGNIKYREIWFGGRNISELYYGEHLVWPDNVPPSPESGNYRYYYKMYDGTSGMSECSETIQNANQFFQRYGDDDNITDESIAPYVTELYLGKCIDTLYTSGYLVLNRSFSRFSALTYVDLSQCEATEIPNDYFSQSASKSNPYTTIKLNDKITKIGDGAFKYCTFLKDIVLPESLKTIGSSAFTNCQTFEYLTLPTKLSEVKSGAFSDCTKIKTVYNMDKMPNISSGVFNGCSSLTEANLPKVDEIGSGAFSDCTSLTSVTFNGNRTIGTNSFSGCTSLKELVLPNSLFSLGSVAFYRCSSLSNDIVIPSYVNSIGSYCFEYCTNVKSFTIKATTPPTLGTSAFDYTNDCPIYVPCGSIDDYLGATNWSRYADRIQPIEEDCRNYRYKRIARDGSVYTLKCLPSDYDNSVTSDNAISGISKSSVSSSTASDTPIEIHIGDCTEIVAMTAFKNWTYLKRVVVYGCEERGLANQCLSGCTSLESLEVYSDIEDLNMISITSVNLKRIEVFGSVGTIYNNLLMVKPTNFEGVFLHQTTPPEIYEGCFTNVDKVYVPCEAVETYKTFDYWWIKEADKVIGYDFENNTICT